MKLQLKVGVRETLVLLLGGDRRFGAGRVAPVVNDQVVLQSPALPAESTALTLHW
jgi:hypothetical protein